MWHKKKSPPNDGYRAQAMMEFALVLPLLLLIVYGMLEVGRLIFMYSIVATASREAVRYGSATGLNVTAGIPRYNDCDGIRAAAQNVDFLGVIDDANIIISYDNGPGTADFSACPPGAVRNTDRIKVQISADFSPIVPIVPLQPVTVSSSSSRTILVEVRILGTGTALIPPPVSYPSPPPPATFTPEASTPGPSPTPTNTATPTATPIHSPTPSSTATATFTPTATYTATYTPTPSNTPTPTGTAFVCNVKHSGSIPSGSDVTWTIYNNVDFTLKIATITVYWGNHGNRNLTGVYLRGTALWTGSTNATGFTIPGGPWNLLAGPNALRLTFSKSTSDIRVLVTFTDQYNCSQTLDSDNISQRQP